MDKVLHIISYHIPYPANNGGLFDVWYKIQALQRQGVQIHLHCFEDNREPQDILHQYCASVNYYPRQTGHKGISTALPYIVASRKHEDLLERLLQDNHPILMEGIHCSYPLVDERFRNRQRYVRLHNVEHQYYRDLAHATHNPLRKLYYIRESIMLKRYEKRIAGLAVFGAITGQDRDRFHQEMHADRVEHLPLFIPGDWTVNASTGMGSFCLYHGDLSVDANEKAAFWLLDQVFSKINCPLVIAGRDPSPRLLALAKTMQHTCLVANPGDRELQDLISKAQVHVLPAFTHTGIKIKLVNAVFHGRHCIVNKAMVSGSGLEPVCTLADTAASFRQAVKQLIDEPFTREAILARQQLTRQLFDNEKNAAQLISALYDQTKTHQPSISDV